MRFELLPADLRALDRCFAGAFDVVLAGDNALPHLLTAVDLGQALHAIATRLRPDGAFLASIRDCDALGRPTTWPARVLGVRGDDRRIVQQVWEWLDERCYRVHIHSRSEVAAAWRSDHRVGHDAGCRAASWRLPSRRQVSTMGAG